MSHTCISDESYFDRKYKTRCAECHSSTKCELDQHVGVKSPIQRMEEISNVGSNSNLNSKTIGLENTISFGTTVQSIFSVDLMHQFSATDNN